MSSAVDLSVDHRSALSSIVETVIAPAAAEVDRTGAYPRAALDALGAAGLLGLSSASDVGGLGGSLADVAETVERISAACGSTAMVVLMHYAAVAVIEAHGPSDVRRGDRARCATLHLAFSESGSRSHFWAPLSTATAVGRRRAPGRDARAGSPRRARPTAYVWSSRPRRRRRADDAVAGARRRRRAAAAAAPFDGLGLRGNASSPMAADGVVVPADARLGDGRRRAGHRAGHGAAGVPRRQRGLLARADGGPGRRGRPPT